MAAKPKHTRSLKRTLGPIADLERHLPSDWWKSLFNSVYLKTDGDVVENAENTRREVDLLVRTCHLEPNDHILDLCCGQGRHSLELARRGFNHVEGIDRSRYLIRLARTRALQEGLNVKFHEGDARKFRFGPTSSHCVAILGNSFGYFESEQDDLLMLRAAKRALVSRGRLLLDFADGDWLRTHFDPRSWEWIDADHFVCRERSLSRDGIRLISREVVVHAERGVIADQFYAERLYSADQIKHSLEQAGFEFAECHESIEPLSDRNQDLGMMAHRIVVTAHAPVKPTSRGAHRIPAQEVTVLLGDIRLPDPVKKDGRFNSEDLDTIDRLKWALSSLDRFSFKYVDRHESLIAYLEGHRPSLVLNLCDEGFNNNPLRELHIPALLELLGIPYTGAGPSCLGLCYNKSLVSSIAQSLEIPVPSETYFHPDDQSATIPSAFPAIVKPSCGDSSVGITAEAVVYSADQLIEYVTKLHRWLPDRALLVQEYLQGSEYSVAIIGNPGLSYTMLAPLEVDYSNLDPSLPKILSYESKWDPESPYWMQIQYREAQIDNETRRTLFDYSTVLFQRLECRDYARFDFRADSDGQIKLLDVNPNPGWCWDGKLNLMAGFTELRYADLLRMILETAQHRLLQQEGAVVQANATIA